MQSQNLMFDSLNIQTPYPKDFEQFQNQGFYQQRGGAERSNPDLCGNLASNLSASHLEFVGATSVELQYNDYPDNTDSNYTHHPYSQYTQPRQTDASSEHPFKQEPPS